MLIAPADRADLLVETVETNDRALPVIRPDIFQAFTRISNVSCPWYERESDSIIWCRDDEHPSPAERFVRIPNTTLEKELALRTSFADSLDPPSREQLRATLVPEQSSLTLFSTLLRAKRLQRQWHMFRTKKLVEHISLWAREANIPWRDQWVTTRIDEFAASGAPFENLEQWRPLLAAFAQKLEEKDLERIAIPLDIVLKAMARRE